MTTKSRFRDGDVLYATACRLVDITSKRPETQYILAAKRKCELVDVFERLNPGTVCDAKMIRRVKLLNVLQGPESK